MTIKEFTEILYLDTFLPEDSEPSFEPSKEFFKEIERMIHNIKENKQENIRTMEANHSQTK